MRARLECAALLASAIGLPALPAAAQATISYTYDALGRVTSASYPNGATVTYTYDNADNRTRVLTQGAMAAARSTTVLADGAASKRAGGGSADPARDQGPQPSERRALGR